MDIGGCGLASSSPYSYAVIGGLRFQIFGGEVGGAGCLPAAPTATRCGGIEISAFGGENGGFRVVKEVKEVKEVREDREVRGDLGLR